MYGSWFGTVMGVVGVLLLLVAAALTAWTPLFALVIFAAAGTVLLLLAAMRRSAEDAPGAGTHRGDPEHYSAPAEGEGSSGDAARASEYEQTPAPESAGIYGRQG
jgi:hypothetical protein